MTTSALPYNDFDLSPVTLSLDAQAHLFDDALRAIDAQKLFACVEWLAHLKLKKPVDFALKKINIKNTFGTTISMRDLGSVINAELHRLQQILAGTKLDIADVAIKWSQSHRDHWAYHLETHTWYQWVGTYWQAQEEEAGKPSPLDLEAIDTLHQSEIAINSNQALNCFRRVAANYCQRNLIEDDTKINFANGTLELSSQTMLPHNREHCLTYCINYNYDPNGSHPEIDAFLKTSIPDEHARQSLMCHVGLALMRDTSFHNFGLLIGPPRAGKSSILGLFNATCGTDPFKFAGPSIFGRDLEGKRARAKWVNYRGVAADELPAEALKEEELLKTMSAHGGVEMRLIGKDEKTSNRWLPKMLLGTNDSPHYKDVSGAIRERVFIVECPNQRPEQQQDKNLFTDKLLPEIGAWAATCIKYALEVKRVGSYPRSSQMRKVLDEIEHLGNPLKAFIRECTILVPKEKITSDLLYKHYVTYISDSGNSPLAKNKMSAAIRDMRIGVNVGAWMRFNNRPSRCLEGIRLRTEYDLEPIDPIYPDDLLLFAPPPLPPSPAPTIKEPEEADPEEYLLDYPECMSETMDPPPDEPCPACRGNNYLPYWGTLATQKWGCGTCHPQILENIGRYNLDKL